MTYSIKKQKKHQKRNKHRIQNKYHTKTSNTRKLRGGDDPLIEATGDGYTGVSNSSIFQDAHGNLGNFVKDELLNTKISMDAKEDYLVNAISESNSQNFEYNSNNGSNERSLKIHKIDLRDSASKENMAALMNENPGINIMHLAARYCMKQFYEAVFKLPVITSDGTDLPEHTKDGLGLTPLHYAVLTNNTKSNRFNTVDFVKFLITHPTRAVNINEQTKYGQTALHMACTKGNFEVVKLLVDNGANMKLFDSKGKTPIHNTSRGNMSSHLEILKYLNTAIIKKEGPKKIPVNIRNNITGYTSLAHAALSGNIDMFKTLLSLGADINNTNNITEDGIFNIQMISDNYRDSIYEFVPERDDLKDQSSESLMFKTIQIMTLFIESGANINHKNKKGNTPLHIILNTYSSPSFHKLKTVTKVDLIKLYMDNGAYPYMKNNDQNVPTCYKKLNSYINPSKNEIDTEATKQMTEYFDTKWGSNSLKYMFENDIEGFKTYLTQTPTIATDVDTTGSTLLHNLVFLHRNTKCVDFINALFEMYPDINLEIKNGNGQTVYDISKERNDTSVNEILLKYTSTKQKNAKQRQEQMNREKMTQEQNQRILKEKDDLLKQEQLRLQQLQQQLANQHSKRKSKTSKRTKSHKPKTSKRRITHRRKQQPIF